MQVERAVWITRAEPGAAATAARVRALGFQPLVAPLLSVRGIGARPDIAGYDALVFTSLNGVRFAPPPAVEAADQTPVLAVGDATAEAARAAGHAEVISARGDVSDLARLIGRRFKPGARLLHLSAAEPAGDLAGAVAPLGIVVERATVYETTEIAPDPDPLRSGQLHAILIHSPRAARALAGWLGERPLPAPAICISRAAAERLELLAGPRPRIAPFPNEDSLLKVLSKA
ncbi:MAG: uroporphyrinogen-III synthase [Caulobacter sp.]|jgi:uroporphyrinogen-III synthase